MAGLAGERVFDIDVADATGRGALVDLQGVPGFSEKHPDPVKVHVIAPPIADLQIRLILAKGESAPDHEALERAFLRGIVMRPQLPEIASGQPNFFMRLRIAANSSQEGLLAALAPKFSVSVGGETKTQRFIRSTTTPLRAVSIVAR